MMSMSSSLLGNTEYDLRFGVRKFDIALITEKLSTLYLLAPRWNNERLISQLQNVNVDLVVFLCCHSPITF
jgi:hypothetical protein